MAKIPKSAELLAVQRTPTAVHFEITVADAAQTFSIPVKAGTFVHYVATVVPVAFAATGDGSGAATLTVGDSASLSGFLGTNDTVLGVQATSNAIKSSFSGGEAYAQGKYFAADSSILLTFANTLVPGTTGTVAGVVKGFVVMSNVKLDGIAE